MNEANDRSELGDGKRVMRGMRWLVLGTAAVLLLVVWPVASHLAWRRPQPALHFVPAFFLGVAVWLVLAGIGALLRGLWTGGFRWLVSGAALRVGLQFGALGLSALVLFYSVESWRGRRAWAAVTEEARRRGVDLDVRSQVPASVPASEDFGQAPIFASLRRAFEERQPDALGRSGYVPGAPLGELGPLVEWSSGMASGDGRVPHWMRGCTIEEREWETVLRRWKQDGSGAKAVVGGSNGLVERVFTTFGPVLDSVRTDAERPHCRLPFDYEFALLGDNIGERSVLALQRAAAWRASAGLVLGRPADARRDVRLALLLAAHAERQPGLFTWFTRAGVLAQTFQALSDGLRERVWAAAELAEFDSLLARLQPRQRLPEHRKLTALSVAGFVEGVVPATGAPRDGWSGMSDDDRRVLGWVRRTYPVGWSLQDQAATLGTWLRFDPAFATTTGASAASAGLTDGGIGAAVCRGTADPLFPAFVVPKLEALWEDGERKSAYLEALARMAQVACAVERHRLGRGNYPENLAALVPEFAAAVPADPKCGGELRYRREDGDRFAVYSVAENRHDDGGKVRSTPGEAGARPENDLDQEPDWVWPGGRR